MYNKNNKTSHRPSQSVYARMTVIACTTFGILAVTSSPSQAISSTIVSNEINVTTLDSTRNELSNVRSSLINDINRLDQLKAESVKAKVMVSQSSVDLQQAAKNELVQTAHLNETQKTIARYARYSYVESTGYSGSAADMTRLALGGPETLSDLSREEQTNDNISNNDLKEALLRAEEAEKATKLREDAEKKYNEEKDNEKQIENNILEQTTTVADKKDMLEKRIDSYTQDLLTLACLQAKEQAANSARALNASASQIDNAKKIWDILINAKFTPQAAAGILGNLQQESTIDPTLLQGGGGIGRGLAQWSAGGRWDTSSPNLLEYAKSKKLSEWSVDAQIGFMLLEMGNGWGGFDLAHYKNMTNVVDATIYFHDTFEKSADTSDFVRNVRGGYSEQWYNTLRDTRVLSPSTPQKTNYKTSC